MKKNIYIICFFSLFLMFSCEDSLNVNSDPNNPDIDQVNPEIMLPGAITRTASTLVITMNTLGNTMAGMWGGNVLEFSGPYNDEFRYNVTSTFYNNIWDNLYTRTANFTSVIEFEQGNYNNHKAVARILRAFYFQYLVDLYGDIPYFQKHLFTENINPTYDNAQIIYTDLVAELNLALSTIANPGEDVEPMGNADVVFDGDMEQWRKLANTIKLRVLLRQSLLTNGDIQAYITNELSGLTSADFLDPFQHATINPGYANDPGKQSPFYAAFGFGTNGLATNGNRVSVASKYIVDLLDGTLASGVVDNRLQRLFLTNNDGEYIGIAQGALLGSLPSGTTLCKMGPGVKVNAASDDNASADAILMTGMESAFLQAEAIARGYLSGNAQSLFESGIASSFNFLGAANANDYIQNIANVDGVGWNSSNGFEAILTQKWIALSCINGIEAWIEMTRTGFPEVPLSLSQSQGSRPKRLLYPQSEISGNSSNVPSQTAADAFNTRLFWDVN